MFKQYGVPGGHGQNHVAPPNSLIPTEVYDIHILDSYRKII